MADNNEAADTPVAKAKSANTAQPTGAEITRDTAAAGIARVRRLGLDPEKIGEAEAEQLRRLGIDSETFERKAVTYNGLIKEFGRPLGPQLYNAIAVTAFGGVQPNRNALSIETLKDRWLVPRMANESDEDWAKREEKHRTQREKVYKLLADAEGGTV